VNDAIHPGKPWLDTDGNRIQAHGGSMHHEHGAFYWYGENKERTKPGSGVWHWGVRCYSSTDLYNWNDEGLIIPPDLDDPSSPLHPAQKMDRPHIVYNAMTDTYVCWLKVMGDGDTQSVTILTAPTLLGPYNVARSWYHPLGMNAGDFDIAVDENDGRAYYYFERVHRELVCADLTDDYTDVTGTFTTHFPHPHPPYVREAPAHFTRNGVHHLITSGTTGYFPNPSEIAVATDFHGPWTVLGDPHPLDPSRTSFRSQISCVFEHPDVADLFVAMADRWLPDVPAELSNVTEVFARLYGGEPLESIVGHDPPPLSDPDTSLADYVWLPLRFDGDMVVIDWLDEWRVEGYEQGH
jgi:hypothetical protein